MSGHHDIRDAHRPDPDPELVAIADYVTSDKRFHPEAYDVARLCLMDSIGCALAALDYPACTKLLGPVVPGLPNVPNGARVPGTHYELDPVQAAFNFGAMVRWLDYNDTWLAAEWGHPSDNLGAILMLGDFLSRHGPLGDTTRGFWRSPSIRDVLTAMIRAYEIQGVIALQNAFNRVGLDHVILVRIASTAVATQMLGGTRQQIIDAVSNAWIDGGALRTYRHAPNTGSRKSWAAGDATSRAVRHALFAIRGEMGYPSALTAKTWGFYDALFRGKPFTFPAGRSYGDYVMRHILFKVSFPAEFHAQTAVECAIQLHPQIRNRLGDIERIVIDTQESAVRIINKTGPLANPADRDHCIQYMTAIGLLHGTLTAEQYEDAAAGDPQIDRLRGLMEVREDKRYTADYLDPEKRSVANAVQVFFADGSSTPKVEVEYPIGHRRRRTEAIPLLEAKFEQNTMGHLTGERTRELLDLFHDATALDAMPVREFVDLLVNA